ncbi:MAG: class I SAM-dependent methyltransferase [Gallionella sp.]
MDNNAPAIPNGVFEKRHSAKDKNAYELTEQAFNAASIPIIDKLEAFPRFSTKRSLARFLVKHELFGRILNINGSIVECGVFNGAGLFTWAQLSNIYEPTNHARKIIGFDTFSGFPSVAENKDNTGVLQSKKGDLKGSTYEQISTSVEKYNAERHLSHITNIHLVNGDFMETSTAYLEKNQHTLVSLLYLDFDLYEPTKRALEVFLPRMPKGSIIAFDELNCESFPGETLAMLEMLKINTCRLERSPIDPWISFVQL